MKLNAELKQGFLHHKSVSTLKTYGFIQAFYGKGPGSRFRIFYPGF